MRGGVGSPSQGVFRRGVSGWCVESKRSVRRILNVPGASAGQTGAAASVARHGIGVGALRPGIRLRGSRLRRARRSDPHRRAVRRRRVRCRRDAAGRWCCGDRTRGGAGSRRGGVASGPAHRTLGGAAHRRGRGAHAVDRRDDGLVDRRGSQLGRVQQGRRVLRIPRARRRARGPRTPVRSSARGCDARARRRRDPGLRAGREGRSRARSRRRPRCTASRACRLLERARTPDRHCDRARALARNRGYASTCRPRARRAPRVRGDSRAAADALARRRRRRDRRDRAVAPDRPGAGADGARAPRVVWACTSRRGLGVHATGADGGRRDPFGSRRGRRRARRARARRCRTGGEHGRLRSHAVARRRGAPSRRSRPDRSRGRHRRGCRRRCLGLGRRRSLVHPRLLGGRQRPEPARVTRSESAPVLVGGGARRLRAPWARGCGRRNVRGGTEALSPGRAQRRPAAQRPVAASCGRRRRGARTVRRARARGGCGVRVRAPAARRGGTGRSSGAGRAAGCVPRVRARRLQLGLPRGDRADDARARRPRRRGEELAARAAPALPRRRA